jgi:VWFA-related protein
VLAVAAVLTVGAAAPGGRSAQVSQGVGQAAPQGAVPAAPPQRPAFRTATNYVRVDVYPTANGQLVPDLAQADFDILEDGVPQKIDTFERVTFRPPDRETPRREISTVAESTDAAADPHSRAFVLFLDSYHTSVDATTLWVTGGADIGSQVGGVGNRTGTKQASANSRIGTALAKFLESTIGADDVIAVMRPETTTASLTFRRRPDSFEEFLLTGGLWQRLDLDRDMDQTERMYFSCYQAYEPATATEMIARRREHMVIETLHNLVLHLQSVREGRKAVLVVSEGWTLFKPSSRLASGATAGLNPIGVQDGRLVSAQSAGGERQVCERDRQMLADLDNEREFVEMLDDANRSNVTFYPIDPRGLAVFNDRTSTAPGNRMFKGQLDSLQTLATATDGIASMNSNDFAKNFKRIADDLSSYYLMGYYSTNTEPDGKVRRITVKVKRPGVSVRARRGYRAESRADLEARSKAEAAAAKPADPLVAAMAALGALKADVRTRVRAGLGWRAAAQAPPAPTVWVVGELDAATARQAEWVSGGTATVTLTSSGGQVVASVESRVSAALRTFSVQMPGPTPLAPGEYAVSVVWRVPSSTSTDGARVTIPPADAAAASLAGQPTLTRRGPFTGAGYQPTADLRFRRQERVRIDVPVTRRFQGASATLLDRAGHRLQVPVVIGAREEGGAVFVTAELALAPLAPGDYVVEITLDTSATSAPLLVPFRIIP